MRMSSIAKQRKRCIATGECLCCSWWWLVLGLACWIDLAQGQREQVLIRVSEINSGFANMAGGTGAARLNFNFGDLGLDVAADNIDIATLGEVASGGTGDTGANIRMGAEAVLPAPDVVVNDLTLLQRNNLVAAARNPQTPAPTQRLHTFLNSGLRRRRNSLN